MFWPYRPRSGYPPIPGWLLLLVLVGGIVLFFVVIYVLANLTVWSHGGY